MPRKLLTADEFRSSAKDDSSALGTVMRVAVGEPQAAEGDRKLRFVFSDGTVDRSGDSIDPAGWQTKTFMDNPVALWAHDSSSPPIGRASNVAVSGSKLMGDIEFMTPDISPFADSIYRMVKAGFVRAVSVGFIPLKWAFVNDKDRPFGIDFTKQELLEISVCPVPCNPNALTDAKALGIDTGPLREWASKVLDEGSCVLVPRNLLEETFRQAKTPRTVRQKYLAKSEAADWKVGAARDLPVDDKDAWDGAAAAKRVLDAAGFDGESPDAAKASQGFLLHDAANPLLRSSYKLPFADIVDGEMRAIKGGVSAAKGRLDQTDAPAAVLDEASAVIDHYEERDGAEKTAPTEFPRRFKPHELALLATRTFLPHEIERFFSVPKEKLFDITKAGRSVSAANAQKLQTAMDHHASATECIKAVLAGNEPDDDGNDPEPDNDPDDDKPSVIVVTAPKVLTEAEQRARRIAEAKALRASAKL